jgi:hypothetical protein
MYLHAPESFESFVSTTADNGLMGKVVMSGVTVAVTAGVIAAGLGVPLAMVGAVGGGTYWFALHRFDKWMYALVSEYSHTLANREAMQAEIAQLRADNAALSAQAKATD